MVAPDVMLERGPVGLHPGGAHSFVFQHGVTAAFPLLVFGLNEYTEVKLSAFNRSIDATFSIPHLWNSRGSRLVVKATVFPNIFIGVKAQSRGVWKHYVSADVTINKVELTVTGSNLVGPDVVARRFLSRNSDKEILGTSRRYYNYSTNWTYVSTIELLDYPSHEVTISTSWSDGTEDLVGCDVDFYNSLSEDYRRTWVDGFRFELLEVTD